ncbi:hypothetical protein ACO34A_03465 [Rhizobium sp. ACO-34A]|nr:hypothetical protein [Rhizobium sp. ACO-34A]ATN32860.1 hypothetical protein ACO34A_03465 [Rhizobium sp. ACO-34A]
MYGGELILCLAERIEFVLEPSIDRQEAGSFRTKIDDHLGQSIERPFETLNSDWPGCADEGGRVHPASLLFMMAFRLVTIVYPSANRTQHEFIVPRASTSQGWPLRPCRFQR